MSFGLVNLPVALVNASRTEELKFRLLRLADLSPVNYKRVAAVDGKEGPWGEIVKGYEYEKGRFIVLQNEDFRRVELEAQKGGAPAYPLINRVLAETNKAGIAKVIIRTRQHLAAVKPNGNLLVLELMRFQDELVTPDAVAILKGKTLGARQIAMAKTLVDQISEPWDPAHYTDDYRSALMKLIDAKIKSGGRELPGKKQKIRATNVVDLLSILQESLEGAGTAPAKKKRPAAPKRKPARQAT